MEYVLLLHDPTHRADNNEEKKTLAISFCFLCLFLNGKCPIRCVCVCQNEIRIVQIEFHFFETYILFVVVIFPIHFMHALCMCVSVCAFELLFFRSCCHFALQKNYLNLWSCLLTNYISISCLISNDYNFFLSFYLSIWMCACIRRWWWWQR